MLNTSREQSIVNNLNTMNSRQLRDTVSLLVKENPELADNVEFLINIALQEKQNAS
jgi:hypothetical protein|tara:strand:- start:304 stop:471 length:168 start_codon:yes stop_codon:yes gene_type:complete